MTKIKKKIIWLAVTCAVTLCLTVGLIIGNAACIKNYNVITSYLCGYGLSDDSKESQAARESGNALAAQVEEAGAVLLKNDNKVLPLKTKKLNVFGWSSSAKGFIPQGTGSGTGSRNDLVDFLGGLKEAGFEYNESLAAAYDKLDYNRVDGGSYVIEAYTDHLYKKYYGVTEAPENFLSDSLITEAKNYSDTAIVVLGRLLGEGNDYSKKQYISNGDNDDTRKLQEISAREEHMLKTVCDNFDKVVVVLNTSNPMELGFINDYDVDSAIYMGLPGTRGTIGLAKILSGEVTPSGKTVDTWAYDISTAASYATSGREGVGSYLDISTDTSMGTRANKYSDYLEDIYIGYKWYETADAEGFWDSDFAKEKWGIANGYKDVVQFPFGYGLSYTNFTWTLRSVSVPSGETLKKNDKITVKLAVTNTGDVAGADVVQLYYSPQYNKGGIEKSALNLGAFHKTAVLNPKQYEEVTIELPVENMKSYDCYDKNNNGFMGYELEEGKYQISLRTDAHTLANVQGGDNTFTYYVPEDGFRYETDSVTGEKVENRFTTYTNPVSGASSIIQEKAVKFAHSIDGIEEPDKIKYMTRNDFIGTFPAETPANRNAGKKLIDEVHYVNVTPVIDSADVAPEFGSKKTSWVISDLFGVPYEDEMWDELISQLPLSTQARLIAKGGFGTIEIDSIDKPSTVDTDGPTGFNNSVVGQGNLKAVCYPSGTVLAQTWDWYMAYQVGNAIGIEANALGIQGWYGPGANLHRSAMGGRNFEYYSEDPVLSGIMCAYEVLGAKEKGLTAYIKHMAVNDSESGRNGAYKWLTEQNMRENYLLPFEYAVKIGKANAMMSSVDRIGGTRGSSSYAMLTSVLRQEWGFRGTVITDYYQCAGISKADQTVHDVDECVRAGNSQLLFKDYDPGLGWFNDSKSNTALKSISTSAKDILYTYADTLHYSETAQGLNKGSSIGESVKVFPWWVILLVVVDVTAAGLMAFWVFMMTRSYLRTKKEESGVTAAPSEPMQQ